MQVVRGLQAVKAFQGQCVASIGNFDGVHLGHQAILSKLKTLAKNQSIPSMVITFEPTPLEFFKGEAAPARLMRFLEQYQSLKDYVDYLTVLPFNQNFAEIEAEDFIKILQSINIKTLVQGSDFRFGKARKGDVDLLTTKGIEVLVPQMVEVEGERVSSTRTRHALQLGNFELAFKLLGRAYSNSGRIIHGAKLGRKLGYPTANIPMRRVKSPVHGIYIVEMLGLGDKVLPGVANVGTRPVVDGEEFLLEVFLFDFDQDIYGKRVEVRYLKKLRDELNFDSLDDLKIQMAIDCQQARDYFNE